MQIVTCANSVSCLERMKDSSQQCKDCWPDQSVTSALSWQFYQESTIAECRFRLHRAGKVRHHTERQIKGHLRKHREKNWLLTGAKGGRVEARNRGLQGQGHQICPRAVVEVDDCPRRSRPCEIHTDWYGSCAARTRTARREQLMS